MTLPHTETKPHRTRLPGPLAAFAGTQPPAPEWFVKALADRPQRHCHEVQGARIESLVWGPEGAPGILLLHGNGAHADWWSFIAPLLADHYRVAAMSWSGMGGSGWRNVYSSDLYVEEAFAVARASGLFDAAVKPSFVGHSYGGFPTMAAASLRGHELNSVVLLDTPLRSPEMQRGRRSARDPAREYKPSRVYPTLEAALTRFRLAPEQACEHAYIVDHIARGSLREVLHEGVKGYTWRFDPFLWPHYTGRDSSADMRTLKCPVTLMWGAQSQLMPAEVLDYMRGLAAPGTRCIEIANANHHVMLDQPLATAAALRETMRQTV